MPESGWTLDTLKALLDERQLAWLRALDLAKQSQDYKDERANALRSQIESERGLYITRHDHELLVEKLDASTESLRQLMESQFIDHRRIDDTIFERQQNAINLNTQTLNELRGRDRGFSTSWGIALGCLGAAGAIFGIVGTAVAIAALVLHL